jgi:hypothetical protein
MKTKKKIAKPRINKKKGGKLDYNLDGPLDTLYHSYTDNKQLQEHVNDLAKRKKDLDKEFEANKKGYEAIEKRIEQEKEEEKRKKEEQKKTDEQLYEKDRIEDQKNSENSVKNIGYILNGLWNKITSGFIYLGYILRNFGTLFEKVWDKFISRIAGKIGNTAAGIIDRIVKGLGEGLRLFLKMIVFPLLFLIIIIVLIWYGFTIFTRKSKKSSTYEESSKHTFEFNVNGLGNLFSMPTIDKSFLDTSALKKLILPIPQYDSIIPKYDNMDLSIWDQMTLDLSNWFKTNSTTAAIADTARCATYGASSLFTGGTQVDYTTLREDNTNGRTDNKAFFETKYIDADLLKQKKIVKDNENIEYNQTALSIAVPEDLEWNFDTSLYTQKDVHKLPPSLLTDTFDKQNVIIIPWERDDYDSQYTLKCDNAYFKESKEKANILINSITEKNTCVLNNSQKPIIYKDGKNRETSANDLSNYK